MTFFGFRSLDEKISDHPKYSAINYTQIIENQLFIIWIKICTLIDEILAQVLVLFKSSLTVSGILLLQ